MLDLTYSNLIELIKPYKIASRTESTAFLHWFLTNIYRLTKIEVDDIICDGRGDKGIDGIYVNPYEGCIDIFQSKIFQRSDKTLGDTLLKEFLGTLKQLETEDGLMVLISSTSNTQLKNLLEDSKEEILSTDYSIRGVFVTNAPKDDNAENLLKTISSSPIKMEVWDKSFISQMYVPSETAIRPTSELIFDVFGRDYAKYNVGNVAQVIIAAISATDLVRMEGIQNQQVFDLNLRKSLGSTKVNKDINQSIEKQEEHDKFLLYHNGITIICSSLNDAEEGKIKIKDYAVVNGCQSVSCLYNKKGLITEDLKILTRIIEIKSDLELIEKITYNSNNQNGIKVRDFRSNTATQIRLQNEINNKYPLYFYQIKTGEKIPKGRTVIDNQLAGRILLVFDLEEPWSVQRITKIFEDFHSKVFARPEVTGDRIVALFEIYTEIQKDLDEVKPAIFRSYQITGFMLLHLISNALSIDKVGKDFHKNPSFFMDNEINRKKVFDIIHIILKDLIIDLNSEFEDRGGENFDFKKAYKSPPEIRKLTNEVIKAYQKLIHRGRVQSFSELWKN